MVHLVSGGVTDTKWRQPVLTPYCLVLVPFFLAVIHDFRKSCHLNESINESIEVISHYWLEG